MKRFEKPVMEIQRLNPEDIFTNSECRVEALGCTSCYCSAVGCGDTYAPDPECPGCFDDVDDI